VQIAGCGEAVGDFGIAKHIFEFLARHKQSLGDPLIEGRRPDGRKPSSKKSDTGSHQPAGAVKHFVDKAISELLNQDLPPYEIIVADDASTDDGLEIVRRLARLNTTIRVVANRANIGVAANLDQGLAMARFSYIYLAASDDWVLPGFFSTAVRMLDRQPSAGLFCGETILIDGLTSKIVGQRPAVRPLYREGFVSPSLATSLLRKHDNWIHTGSAVFRREAIVASGGLIQSLGTFADGYLARKIAITRGFVYSPKPVAIWRVMKAGESRKIARDLGRAKGFVSTICGRIAADPDFPPWYVAVFRDRLRFAFCRLAVEEEPIDYDMLNELGSRNRLDQNLFSTLRRFVPVRSLQRVAILAWLAFRLRPVSLVDLLFTRFARLREDWFGPRSKP
jgi:glycosyltransferase involved in cell wall biosynthesis